jgi:hypothetical protein
MTILTPRVVQWLGTGHNKMSLTSLISNKDVKARFAQDFPMPKFNKDSKLLAPPLTNRYSLMGTAFDYLMRFYLKRLNPKAITTYWVAEATPQLVGDDTRLLVDELLLEAHVTYDQYLKTGDMNDGVLRVCLLLGQLDPIYRAHYIDPNLGTVDSEDIKDLYNLISIVNAADFQCRDICMLNPTFGMASRLVGGADMDLFLDDTLIDIKVTKTLDLKRDYLNQLIGYYVLSLLGGIDKAPKKLNIENVGIYYARHGLLYKVPIQEIIAECDMGKFIDWFKERANQEFSLGGQDEYDEYNHDELADYSTKHNIPIEIARGIKGLPIKKHK